MRWRSAEDRRAASEVLPDVLDRANVDDGKLGYHFNDYTVVRTAKSVLSKSVSFSDKVPEYVRPDLVAKAIVAMLGATEAESDEFLSRIEKAQRAYLRKRPKTWVMLSRLSLNLPETRLRSFRWGGVGHRLTRRRPPGFERPERCETLEAEQLGANEYCWLRREVIGRDEAAAGELGLALLDEWRGVVNYTLTYDRMRIWFEAGYPDPVNRLVAGPVHSIHDPKQSTPSDMFWWEPSHLKPIPTLEFGEHLDRVQKLLATYRSRVGRSRAGPAIRQLFVRYARALDDRDMHSAFLKLWGVLEVASDTTLQRYDETIRRAAAVWTDRKKARAVLQHLRNHRNDLVHRGTESSSPGEMVYSLKTYVDELLGRLVGNAPDFDSLAEFGTYLDLLRRPDDLKRMAHLVRKARRAQ